MCSELHDWETQSLAEMCWVYNGDVGVNTKVCIVNSYRLNNLVLISLETCHSQHCEAQVGIVQAS